VCAEGPFFRGLEDVQIAGGSVLGNCERASSANCFKLCLLNFLGKNNLCGSFLLAYRAKSALFTKRERISGSVSYYFVLPRPPAHSVTQDRSKSPQTELQACVLVLVPSCLNSFLGRSSPRNLPFPSYWILFSSKSLPSRCSTVTYPLVQEKVPHCQRLVSYFP
jgi:hypothetical protein